MTTIKPGMHQIVEDKGVDFNAIVAKMAQVKPQSSFPMMGWGRKCFIQATLKKKGNKVVVEIFSEVTFGAAPTNTDIGYTRDEANLFRGVCVTDYESEADNDGYHPSRGEIMEYDVFVDKYITDTGTRIILDRVMESMGDLLIINDQMIDRVNNAWENRDPGEQELFSVQYM